MLSSNINELKRLFENFTQFASQITQDAFTKVKKWLNLAKFDCIDDIYQIFILREFFHLNGIHHNMEFNSENSATWSQSAMHVSSSDTLCNVD